jgi:hypothetical protein
MANANLDMNDLVQRLTQHLIQNPNLAAALGPAANRAAPATTTADTRWRLEEIGIFEPDLPIDERHPEGDVITVGRDTIYRNVDAFCERILDAISSKGHEVVRDNLQSCLRGQAIRWFTHELAAIDKRAIRADPTQTLEQWTTRLQDRFRPRMAQAVRENNDLSFRISDIRAGKRVIHYFQTKILRARAAGFETVHAQLI